MILDRKTYKDIEMHFKAYLSDKEYVIPKGYICPWCKTGNDYEIFKS